MTSNLEMTNIEIHKVECEVTFLSKSEEGWGKTVKPILNGNWYRPLLVIGDPNQRKAILTTRTYEVENPDGSKRRGTSDRWLAEEYASVSFDTGPNDFEFDVPIRVKLSLMPWPGPQYEKVQPGKTFTVREGPTVVGFGKVISEVFVEPTHQTPHPWAPRP
jgi:hypothetical protein